MLTDLRIHPKLSKLVLQVFSEYKQVGIRVKWMEGGGGSGGGREGGRWALLTGVLRFCLL